MFVIYPLLIILFNAGKYRSLSFSPRSFRRECGEAIVVFGVILVFFWLRAPTADLVSRLLTVSFEPIISWTIGNIFFLLASSFLLLFMEKVVRKRGLSTIGFKLPTNRKVLLIFAGVIIAYLAGATIRLALGFHIQVYTFISAVILAPLAEETVFRGLIQTRLEASFGPVKSWILSGLLFGFYHFYAWFIVGTSYHQFTLPQLIGTALFGMLAGVIFAKTRSLFPPLLLHAVNNLFSSLV